MTMMLTRNCWRIASITRRAAISPRWPAVLRRGSLMPAMKFSHGDNGNKQSTEDTTYFKKSYKTWLATTDANHLLNMYRTTDFETTLMQAPKYTYWAAIVPLVPLVAKTAWVAITLSFGTDYASAVMACVSAYVCTANGWWLSEEHNKCSSCNDPVATDSDESSSSSSSSWSMLQSFEKTVGPSMISAIAIVALPQPIAVMAVTYAAFLMTCRLVLTDITTPPWSKSLVLLVYGACLPNLMLALVSTLFS